MPCTSSLPSLSLCALALSVSACDATLGSFDATETGNARENGISPTEAASNDPFSVVAEGCEPQAHLVEPPLRRLTNSEYSRTVTRLFGVDAPEADGFPADEATAGFASNWVSAVGDKHVEDYEAAALALAERILATDPETMRACPLSGLATGSAACVEERIAQATASAYRRAPEVDELSALVAFHQSQEVLYGAADADRMLLEVLFQTPQFLYVAPPYAGTEAASLASRLAYFLTGHPPDAQLSASAEDGTLLDPAVQSAEVDRLLASDDAPTALLSFFTQWLDLERLEVVAKDDSVYGTWSEDLRHDMFEETELFIESVIRSGGGLPELLTSRSTWASPALADLYGVAEQHGGVGFEEVLLPEGQRAGLLTQASFLAGHSHQVDSSWVLRGDFVRRHLLCDELPPPPDVDFSLGNDAGRLEDPSCSNCHLLMDPIGQSFDRYDALGRYSESDPSGAPIPTGGELHPGTEPLDVSGAFDGPLELAETLSTSDSVHACLSRQMLRFALRRLDQDEERCGLLQVAQGFSDSGGDLKSLMRAIALSPAMTLQEQL